GSFNGWSPTATPMNEITDQTFVAYVHLDEGLHQYKFVVNGNVWRPDSKADPDLRTPDGHEGFNSGIFIGEQGKDYGPATGDINLNAVRHKPEQATYLSPVTSDFVQIRLRALQGNLTQANLVLQGEQTKSVPMHTDEPQFGFD